MAGRPSRPRAAPRGSRLPGHQLRHARGPEKLPSVTPCAFAQRAMAPAHSKISDADDGAIGGEEITAHAGHVRDKLLVSRWSPHLCEENRRRQPPAALRYAD